MKATVVSLFFLMIAISPAHAQDRRFGAGVMGGIPSGVNAKYWLGQGRAVDAAAGWTFGEHDAFQLHGDYLFHDFRLLQVHGRPIPVYAGLGARLNFDDDTVFGIRFPLGITYPFRQDPFDVFLEVAPIFDLAPDADLDINATIGLRYYFE